MKSKVTRKSMRMFNQILSVPYCSVYYLLKYHTPIAYSAGTYGWDCDYYYLGGVLISAGYRPLNTKDMEYDMEKVYAAEKAACEVWESNKTREEKDEIIDKMLYTLIDDLK